MRRSLLAVIAVMAVCGAACVDVPDSIHAQFAAPQPQERSNFRPGNHGTAPPVDDAPTLKAAPPLDAGSVETPQSPQQASQTDGGVS